MARTRGREVTLLTRALRRLVQKTAAQANGESSNRVGFSTAPIAASPVNSYPTHPRNRLPLFAGMHG